MKIALYDFCDTIVSFQTANPFVLFVLNKMERGKLFLKIISLKCVNGFLSKHWRVEKAILLYQLKGIEYIKLKELAGEYYKEMIYSHLHHPVLNNIDKLKKEGYKIYVVSGGYKIYIEYFVKQFGLDGVIANELQEKKGLFTGRLQQKDCMGEAKLERIKSYFSECIFDDVICVSDSISDLPMLRWGNKGIVISKTAHRKWPDEYGFDQIVLSQIPKD